MGKERNYESRVEKHLLPLVEEYGFELIDVEYIKEVGTWYLRVYTDKEGGITVDDCKVASRVLDDWLDREDFIGDSYILEINSPGLGHPLRKEKDFVRSMSKDMGVRLYRRLNKQKESTDALGTYNEGTVTLTTEDRNQMVSEKVDIALIRLALDFQLDHSHAKTWIEG